MMDDGWMDDKWTDDVSVVIFKKTMLVKLCVCAIYLSYMNHIYFKHKYQTYTQIFLKEPPNAPNISKVNVYS